MVVYIIWKHFTKWFHSLKCVNLVGVKDNVSFTTWNVLAIYIEMNIYL